MGFGRTPATCRGRRTPGCPSQPAGTRSGPTWVGHEYQRYLAARAEQNRGFRADPNPALVVNAPHPAGIPAKPCRPAAGAESGPRVRPAGRAVEITRTGNRADEIRDRSSRAVIARRLPPSSARPETLAPQHNRTTPSEAARTGAPAGHPVGSCRGTRQPRISLAAPPNPERPRNRVDDHCPIRPVTVGTARHTPPRRVFDGVGISSRNSHRVRMGTDRPSTPSTSASDGNDSRTAVGPVGPGRGLRRLPECPVVS